MQFDLELAIQIGKHLREQDLTRAIIGHEDIHPQSDNEERWKVDEILEGHLLLMQDAGWLDSVQMFNVAGAWEARLTYQGHLWLDAATNESLMERIKQAIQIQGIRAANTVVAEAIKGIVSTAT